MDNVIFANNKNAEPNYDYRVSILEYLRQDQADESEKIFLAENPMFDFTEAKENRACFDSDMLDYTSVPDIIEIFPHFPREYYPILEEIRDKGKKKFFSDLKLLRKQEKKNKKKAQKKKGNFSIENKKTVMKFD